MEKFFETYFGVSETFVLKTAEKSVMEKIGKDVREQYLFCSW